MGCGCEKSNVKEEKPIKPNMEVISDRRMTICRLNKCGKYLKLFSRCKECGCFLRLKTKIHSQKCPLGYW